MVSSSLERFLKALLFCLSFIESFALYFSVLVVTRITPAGYKFIEQCLNMIEERGLLIKGWSLLTAIHALCMQQLSSL